MDSPHEADVPRVRTISDATKFRAAYCRDASLDWSRFRLVTLTAASRVVDVDVARSPEQYRVVLTTRPTCEASFGEPVHLLLPADALPVSVVEKPAPAPDCPEGYGY